MTIQKTKPTYHDLTKLMFTNGNPKTDKNLKIESLKKYWIKRLNLAPSNISGFNMYIFIKICIITIKLFSY